ncbi:Protein Aknad1 [Manis pentadactyla]|nr:Protein Aknad1 [Manis pentadactyla]
MPVQQCPTPYSSNNSLRKSLPERNPCCGQLPTIEKKKDNLEIKDCSSVLQGPLTGSLHVQKSQDRDGVQSTYLPRTSHRISGRKSSSRFSTTEETESEILNSSLDHALKTATNLEQTTDQMIRTTAEDLVKVQRWRNQLNNSSTQGHTYFLKRNKKYALDL